MWIKDAIARCGLCSLLLFTAMAQAGSISGVVVDSDGAAISGATVYLNDEVGFGHWQAVDSVLTDAQGHYSFQGISGSVFVNAELDDVHSIAIPGGYDCNPGCAHVGPSPGPYSPALDPSEDRVAQPIVLNIAAAVILHVVRASDGSPVYSAYSEAQYDMPASAGGSSPSNNIIKLAHLPVTAGVQNHTGVFIETLEEDNLLSACADDAPVGAFGIHQIAWPCQEHDIEIDPGVERDITIHLSEGSMLEGRLLESVTGGPAINAELELYKADDHQSRLDWAVDGNGHYRIGPLLPGSYDLLFSHPVDYDLYQARFYPDTPCNTPNCDQLSPSPITVESAGTTIHLQDTSIAPRQWLAGQVVDAQTSQPLAKVQMQLWKDFYSFGEYIWAMEEETATDANGAYVFVGIEPDGYTVRALDSVQGHIGQRKPDVVCGVDNSFCSDPPPQVDSNGVWQAPYMLDPDTHADGVNFALDKGAVISGHVSNRATGKALSQAHVFVISDTGDGEFVTDASGNFRTAGLPSADVTAYARNSTQAQLYQDMDCPSVLACDTSQGTPIHVGTLQQVTGIDFSLAPDADSMFSSGFDAW